MFCDSDAHAESAAAKFTLIATCRLLHVGRRQYLDELMRFLPYWPRERFHELAPQHCARTRARLDPDELAAFVSRFTVPPSE